MQFKVRDPCYFNYATANCVSHNKDSQGTSDVIAHDLHGALFHAPVMFSPGVESEPQIRDDNDIRYGPIRTDRWPSFSIIASGR